MLRKIRILLAWIDEQEAISALHGFRLVEPSESTVSEKLIYRQKVQALRARPGYVAQDALVGELPARWLSQAEMVLESALVRSDAQARDRFSVAIVDLTRIIAFQRAVEIESNDRFSGVESGDFEELFALCLPLKNIEENVTGTFDRDGKGLTISSLNPNLRAGFVQTIELPEAHGTRMMGFPVDFGSPFLHVVEYMGRYFLKDGYHRSFGLLQRGITHVPVVLQKARSFGDIHTGSHNLVGVEILLGDRPPMLTDFHDLAVAANVEQQAVRKVIRIHAEEFVVKL